MYFKKKIHYPSHKINKIPLTLGEKISPKVSIVFNPLRDGGLILIHLQFLKFVRENFYNAFPIKISLSVIKGRFIVEVNYRYRQVFTLFEDN